MRRFTSQSGWVLLFAVVFGLALPGYAVDAKKDAKKADDDKTEAKEKLVPAGMITAKIGWTNPDTKAVKLDGQNDELPLADDMQVRLAQPKSTFDDKGREKKKFTSKELKEMKGDSKLPGYPGDFSDLKNGQVVQIYFGKKKVDKNATPAEKKAARETKPVVTAIIIGN